MLVILIEVSTWLQFVVITDLSGQMLRFNRVWHFGEVFSSRMNPGFHCTGQMADSVYGIVWVSGLLMSTLWIEWPIVAVGLWYGQSYVMDNEHWCILLMAFWMHRDTVMRSWGPLLCHSSTTITSCGSMIMHGPMLQGSVHNSWKLKKIPVLAWPAYSPKMSPIEHVWDALDRHIWQRVPVPAYIQQHRTAIEEEWTNFPQATINNLINYMRRRWVALQMVVAPDTDWFSDPPNTAKLLEWPFIVASLRNTCAIIMLSNQHLDMPHLWGGWIISAKEKCSLTQI